MVNNNQDHKFGLAISTPDPRAVTGKNACAALRGVKLVPDPFFIVADQAQESAPPYSDNPRPSIDGLPCAIPPGAQLTGGGISTRPQSFSFQSGDHFPDEFASSFPSQMSSLPSGASQ
jgi:hypothetical protein